MRMIQEQIAIAEAAKRTITMSDTEKQINYEVRVGANPDSGRRSACHMPSF